VKLAAMGIAMVLLAGPVLAADDELDAKYQSFKDAVAQKDPAQVKKIALELYPMICMELSAPAPQKEEEKESWTNRQTYVKGINEYLEYGISSTVVGSTPAVMVDMIALLEQQFPKSKYLNNLYGPYLVTLNQTGAAAKIPGIAEKALANFPENEDLLLYLTDYSLNRKQTDRALTYANRLVAALNKHPKPEGVSAADWDRKRSAGLARGYWIAGVIYGEKSQFMACDKSLRAALPLIQGNAAMLGPALFYLGNANYQLGKQTLNKALVLEGAKFSEQCAAMDTPLADQARHNALVMRNEAARMR